jgi:hypothetical protein
MRKGFETVFQKPQIFVKFYSREPEQITGFQCFPKFIVSFSDTLEIFVFPVILEIHCFFRLFEKLIVFSGYFKNSLFFRLF